MENKEQAFTQLVREHKSTIYSVCYMFSKDSDEIDDLFQEILIRLWKGYNSFRAESDVRTWIYRVSLNCCLNADKKKKSLSRERIPLSVDIDPFEDTNDRVLQTKRLYAPPVARRPELRGDRCHRGYIGEECFLPTTSNQGRTQKVPSLITRTMNKEEFDINQELEQMRQDYAALKERFDKQQIINEKLMENVVGQKQLCRCQYPGGSRDNHDFNHQES